VRYIQSRDHPLCREVARIQRAGGAIRRERRAVIEGEHLVEACLHSAPGQVEVILLRGQPPPPLPWASEERGVCLSPMVYDRLSLLATPPTMMALVRWNAPVGLSRQGFVLAIDAVQDPGNVGTLIRTAAAAGVDEVWVDTASASAWSSKTLRSAQGAHWQVRVADGVDLPIAIQSFAGRRWALLPGPRRGLSATWLDEVASEERYAADKVVIASNEGGGLSAQLWPLIDRALMIPMAAGVESLNVSVAAGIALYALRPEALGKR